METLIGGQTSSASLVSECVSLAKSQCFTAAAIAVCTEWQEILTADRFKSHHWSRQLVLRISTIGTFSVLTLAARHHVSGCFPSMTWPWRNQGKVVSLLFHKFKPLCELTAAFELLQILPVSAHYPVKVLYHRFPRLAWKVATMK